MALMNPHDCFPTGLNSVYNFVCVTHLTMSCIHVYVVKKVVSTGDHVKEHAVELQTSRVMHEECKTALCKLITVHKSK